MVNAKEELEYHIEKIGGISQVKCAKIGYGGRPGLLAHDEEYALKVGFSEEDYLEFINSLDFGYNNGYGSQKFFGTVWLKDGSWLGRGEYDGSEWWEHFKTPEIPEEIVYKPDASAMRELREICGASMRDCRKALEETGGDIERALRWLTKIGQA